MLATSVFWFPKLPDPTSSPFNWKFTTALKCPERGYLRTHCFYTFAQDAAHNIKQTGAMPNMKQTGAMPNMKQTGAMPNMKQTGAMPNMPFPFPMLSIWFKVLAYHIIWFVWHVKDITTWLRMIYLQASMNTMFSYDIWACMTRRLRHTLRQVFPACVCVTGTWLFCTSRKPWFLVAWFAYYSVVLRSWF